VIELGLLSSGPLSLQRNLICDQSQGCCRYKSVKLVQWLISNEHFRNLQKIGLLLPGNLSVLFIEAPVECAPPFLSLSFLCRRRRARRRTAALTFPNHQLTPW